MVTNLRHVVLLLLATFCCNIGVVHGQVPPLGDQQEEDCPVLGCCVEDCCGPGLTWVDPICVINETSPGFTGTYFSPGYGMGCDLRVCCEEDCCGPGTTYDSTIQCCVPRCEIIPESQAVLTSEIAPFEYPRIYIELGEPIVIASGAASVQIQAPTVSDDDSGSSSSPAYEYPDTYSLCYDASTDTYVATILAEGTFHTVVDGVISSIFSVAELDEKQKKGKTGCTEKFQPSNAELVVSADTNDQRLDYYKNVLKQTVVEVPNVAQAVTAVQNWVTTNNRKLKKLTIAEHGTCGDISIGGGKAGGAGKEIGKTDAASPGAPTGSYQALVNGLKGQFTDDAELCLVGCYVGEGQAGQNLVDCLAKDLNIKVRAKKGAVSYPRDPKSKKRYALSSGEKGWAMAPKGGPPP